MFLNKNNWKPVIQKRCHSIWWVCVLHFVCHVKLQIAVANSAFISACSLQAGAKNIRYLSFPYSHPQPARGDREAAAHQGDLRVWLLSSFLERARWYIFWGLEAKMKNQDYYIGTSRTKKRERETEKGKKNNFFINLIQKFIDGHWNLNFLSFYLSWNILLIFSAI